MAGSRGVARSGAFAFVGAVVSAVAGLLLVIVLGRSYGAAGSGVMLQGIAAFTIALSLARGGLDTTSLWLLPRLRHDQPEQVRATVVAVLSVAGVLGLLAGLVLAAVGALARGRGEEVGLAVLMLAAALPIAAVMTVGLAAIRALGGIRAYVGISSIGIPLARPILVVLAALAGIGVPAVVLAWAAPLPVAAAIVLLILRRSVRRVERRTDRQRARRLSPDLRVRMRRYAVPRAISAVLEQCLLWVDILLVGILAGPAAAGLYGAATRFANAGRIVSTALRIVVAPIYSRLLGDRQIGEVQRLYVDTSQWIVYFSTPVYLLLMIFPTTFLGLLGGEFDGAATALVILSVGVVVWLLGGNIHSVLLMSGHSAWGAIDKGVTLAALILGIWILTPQWGIEGAAWAWTLSMVVDVGLGAFQVQRLVGVRVGGWSLALALVLAGPVTALPMIGVRAVVGDEFSGLMLAGLCGFLVWATCGFALRRSLALEQLGGLFRRRR